MGKTIKEEVGAVQRMLGYAVQKNYLRLNPADSPLLALPKVEKNRFPPIGAEEREIAFKDIRLGTYYMVLYYTGLRAGDVAALTSDLIDKRAEVIIVPGAQKTDTPAAIHDHRRIRSILKVDGCLFEDNPESFYKKAHASFK